MTGTSSPSQQKSPEGTQDRLISLISTILEPLGYEVVYLEVLNNRAKTLRLFIDHLSTQDEAIGVEDCVKVAKVLDEPLDQMAEVDGLFHGGAYELEVSSPGIERPLRQPKDYTRFEGKEARIHTFRPLAAEEIENSEHQKNNPKQKNFLGILKGVRDQKVLLQLSESSEFDISGKSGKKGKAKSAKPVTKNSVEKEEATLRSCVAIPLPLISKAHLQPRFDVYDEIMAERSNRDVTTLDQAEKKE